LLLATSIGQEVGTLRFARLRLAAAIAAAVALASSSDGLSGSEAITAGAPPHIRSSPRTRGRSDAIDDL
jgi:hypothetical protein